MAWDFSNGLLGMGGFGMGGNNMPANSLLGDFYNPADMRKYQMKQMLLGLGAGLMAEKGFGKGAALALAAGDRAGSQYRDSALDAYRIKSQQEQQEYQRQQDAEEKAWRQKQWDYNVGRDKRAQAWQDTQNQRTLEAWQQEDDQRAAADQAWNNIRRMPSTGVPVQNYGLADQLYKMGRTEDALGVVMPPPPKQYDPTDDMREYAAAVQQGFNGTLQDWIMMGKSASAPKNMGAIPPGYRAVYDNQGNITSLEPIPGSPAASEQEKIGSAAEAIDNKRLTMTDTIATAADSARELADSWAATGLTGQAMSNIGTTDAAELVRQVEVLKSNAKIENLNAMRRESPTGGALGSVTEKETAMLASAAGALDPAAGPERFKQQLDNYELTLMRVIHGYEAGTQLFMQRKGAGNAKSQQGAVPSSGPGAPNVRKFNPKTGRLE